MSKIEKFEDIKSWQLAREVSKKIDELRSNKPSLTIGQLRIR